MQDDSEKEKNPFDDLMLRREAGEHWFPGGPIRPILGAIVAREAISQEIIDEHDEDRRTGLLQDYADQEGVVNSLKERYGLGEAPPRSDP